MFTKNVVFFINRHFDRVSTTLRFARNDEGKLIFSKKCFSY